MRADLLDHKATPNVPFSQAKVPIPSKGEIHSNALFMKLNQPFEKYYSSQIGFKKCLKPSIEDSRAQYHRVDHPVIIDIHI